MYPKAYKQNLVKNGLVVSEKSFNFPWAKVKNDLGLQYSQTFINSISCLHLSTFRSQAIIVSEKNPLFSLFRIEKPILQNLTLP